MINCKAILLTLSLICLSACSRDPLSGTVYVIKGDGSITRAASIRVAVLPFTNESDFQTARSQWSEDANRENLRLYQSNLCRLLPGKIDAQRRINSQRLTEFSEKCLTETQRISDLDIQGLGLSTLSQLVEEKEALRTSVIERVADQLKKEANNNVEVSFDYTQNDFGYARIKNNTKYYLTTTTGVNALAGFVNGVRVYGSRQSKFYAVVPGQENSYNLGEFYSTAQGDVLKESPDSKICWEKSWGKGLCLEDFGVQEADSSVPGGFRRAEWVFIDRSAGGAVKFDGLAKTAPEVKAIDTDLVRLRNQIKSAQIENDALESCETLTKQTNELGILICPKKGSKREALSDFALRADSLGLMIKPLPEKVSINVIDFAEKKALMSVVTDVNGAFVFENPPPGDFLLHATYRDNFNEIEWLVPVSGDVPSIELNNSNSR